MRLVIELPTLAAPGTAPQEGLGEWDFAMEVVKQAHGHEVLLVLSSLQAHRMEALRSAFSGWVPNDRIRLWHVPAVPDTRRADWLQGANEPLRWCFWADLAPDVVMVPAAQEAVPSTARTANSTPWVTRTYDPFSDARQQAEKCCQSLGNARAQPPMPVVPQRRPRLAYISPLPPEKSGIADYSVELIEELANYYDLEVVVDQAEVVAPWVNAHLVPRTVEWFEAHANTFERVLYHVGNSPAHQHMFALMEKHPGIVVLHDFYLSNVLHHLDMTGYTQGAFARSLYASHGWQALMDRKSDRNNTTVWNYPCNKEVIDQADGIIVHSRHSCDLADQWYGAGFAKSWQTLPLLRGFVEPPDRARARAALGLSDEDFLVCSFGMLGPTKLNARLLQAWRGSGLAADKRCKLVFVGENDGGLYGQNLLQSVQQSGLKSHIEITGFVSHERYRCYLSACDAAVQLRGQSRGETSAAVLDCLLYGVATIANAHGAIAELPDAALRKVADDFDDAELTAALDSVWTDAPRRRELGQAAQHFVATSHAPAAVGLQYRDAIEALVLRSPKRHYGRLVKQLGAIGATAQPSSADLREVASCIAANAPRTLARQFFVDISAMVQTDLKTGIQRVVRSILMALIAKPPPGFRIEPVYTLGAMQPYRYARRYMEETLGLGFAVLDDDPIDAAAGDRFLGLDLFLSGTHQNQPILQGLRDRGVDIYFVVFDILPLLRPDCFPEGTDADFRAWLKAVATVSDGLLCISHAVANEVAHWLRSHPAPRSRPLHLGFFHLGADIDASAPSKGLAANAKEVLGQMRARPSVLSVGTVEPRKGHAQTLSAFELLWSQGVDANCVIVGKNGWMVDALAQRLETHPEAGKRLFWMHSTSDEMLLQIYQASSGLLAASEGEGFGLPLIEAAQHGLAIIARDIPVFREVMGEHAMYFEGLAPADLAVRLKEWLALLAAGAAPSSAPMTWLTWAQSAQQLVRAIEGGVWCHTVGATS